MSSFELYSFATMFEGSIEFKWGPHEDEPLIVANKIDIISRNLEDFELPLIASRQLVVDDMERRFDAEVDLRERKWKRLSRNYLNEKRKAGFGDKTILRREDTLFNAVTDPSTYKVVGNNLYIDTASWPDYWHAHDAGEYLGRNSKLPKRSFAGVSEMAQFEIIDIFDDWIDGQLQIIRPGVTGVAMFRGAFGHVGGRIAFGMPRRKIAGFFGMSSEIAQPPE